MQEETCYKCGMILPDHETKKKKFIERLEYFSRCVEDNNWNLAEIIQLAKETL